MADVQPLRGLRYNSEVTGNLAQVLTPPYDVISEEAQARYYARNPYNIIRLELGMDEPGDTSLNNRYTRAADIHIQCPDLYTHQFVGSRTLGAMERTNCTPTRAYDG